MNSDLEDFKINIRIKLSALWTSLTFCYLYGDYFELYVPHKVEGLMNGNNLLDSPAKLFLAAILLAIPAVMVFLSLTLRPVINKWVNIILGLFYTAVMILVGITSVSAWLTFYVFFAVIEICLTSLIVWSAWNWQRRDITSEK